MENSCQIRDPRLILCYRLLWRLTGVDVLLCHSCKDGEDTVFEELQCVPARGRPLAEEDLLGGYRYIDYAAS